MARTKKLKTDVEKATDALEKALDEEFRLTAYGNIVRKGSQIIIPEFAEPENVAKALLEWVKQREEEVEKEIKIRCHPDDGLANLDRAVHDTIGKMIGVSQTFNTFFGTFKVPGQARTVKISFTETVTVPYGHIEVPALPIVFDISVTENKNDPMRGELVITAAYKRKYEPLIEMIESKTREYIKTRSIFKEQAINSNFEFIDPRSALTDKLVYSEYEERVLNANLFNVIRNTEVIERAGIPLKRTLLFLGKYGTGKTLTANKAAEVCTENHWTFINVIPGDDIVKALNFAKNYEPCVVFFEDIDAVASGKRDEAINSVLNTVDGIISKNSRVLTILTTNNVERIERALLRPGRIDEVIRLGELDEVSMKGLVHAYVGDSLEGELDVPKLLEVASGYTPSFVAEASKHALLFAIARAGEDAKITHQDIYDALKGLRAQYELMEGIQDMEEPEFENIVDRIVTDVVQDQIDSGLKNFAKQMNPQVFAKEAEILQDD